jgi:tRNA G18 (ribose-2'-O)-methylase SpoU
MAHYIYGKNVVKQWILNRRPIRHLYLSQERPDQEILRLAKEASVPIESWSPKAFSKIDGLHQNVVAELMILKPTRWMRFYPPWVNNP